MHEIKVLPIKLLGLYIPDICTFYYNFAQSLCIKKNIDNNMTGGYPDLNRKHTVPHTVVLTD